jgi:hypothetical protein
MNVLRKAKLMGQPNGHPAIPGHDVNGRFIIEPGVLLFVPDNSREMRIAIPLENLRRYNIFQGLRNEAQRAGWFVWGLPITVLTMTVVTPKYTFLTLYWWEDLFDQECYASFQIGDLFGLQPTQSLVQAIWAEKANNKQALLGALRPHTR